MPSGKRYFWLKLQDDFFDSKRIKKLRKIAGGDTYTIIYLEMQLLAMKNNGYLEYTGLENSFAEELALDLDEEPDNVSVAVNYLLSCGLLETSNNKDFYVPYAVLNTASEGASAKRMRDFRERKASLCDTSVTQTLQIGDGEIEIDKETDKEIDNIYHPREAEIQQKKHKYGEYNNVLLTDKELEKLKAEFSDWEERIERVSAYVASTGKSYKSHFATIRNWARKDCGAKSSASRDYGSPEDFYR